MAIILEHCRSWTAAAGLKVSVGMTNDFYAKVVEPLVRPRLWDTSKLYAVGGERNMKFQGGSVVVKEPTISCNKWQGKLCWHAELEVGDVKWTDQETGSTAQPTQDPPMSAV
jgi:hypothetical protein